MITLDVNKMPDGIRPSEVKVFFNGRDVTNQCGWAVVPAEPGKVGRGVVRLYRLTKSRNKFTTLNRKGERVPAQTVKVGRVRWERIIP